MDPYVIDQLMSARRDDLVRDAEGSRIARRARDTHEEVPPRPASGDGRVPRLRIA